MASKGRPKPKLRDLGSHIPTDEEWDALHEAMFEGPPMVTAILGQAFVEIELDRMLRKAFNKANDETWAKLTDDRGPLSTFYAKIVAGGALGLYDEYTEEYLDRIRKVRNAFAHSKLVIDFSQDLVIEEIRMARLPAKNIAKDEKKSWKSGAIG